MTDQTPASEREITDNQRRWLGALAQHHGVEPDQIPDGLTAAQAGGLISKWSKTLPRSVRKTLGDQ